MSELIVLDPPAVSDASRQQLDITSWVDADGADWGDADIQSYEADLTVGSTPVDYRIPNRIVKIPLNLRDLPLTSFTDVRSRLQRKTALFQREGGWVQRQVGSTNLYADVVNATLHLGGSWLAAYRNIDVEAVLQLECRPEFYEDEVTLDTLTGTGRVLGVLQAGSANAVIGGDYPGRVRVIVTNTSGSAQRGLIWGFRCCHYASTAGAALFYEAESLTGLNGAAAAARSGASGGTVLKGTALPAQADGLWVPLLLTDIPGTGQLTHQGSYRVLARVWATDAGSSVRLVWGEGSLASPVENDPVAVPGTGAFYLLDLGVVRLDATPVATGAWQGVIQVQDPNGSGTFEIDTVILQPLDESSGKVSAGTVPSATVVPATNPSTTNPSYLDDTGGGGTVAWFTNLGFGPSSVTLSNSTSHFLNVSSYGFAVPSGATILGIDVKVKRSVTGSGSSAQDTSVKLLKAGSRVGSDKAASALWPHSPKTREYGGSGDLWGTTWTPTDINNSGFGVSLKANGSGGLVVASVTVTVYYKLSTGFTVAQDVVINTSSQCEIRTEGVFRLAGDTSQWGPISTVLGDLPRIPPSGLEARPVEILVRPSRGNLDDEADSGLDGLSVVVKYRPSYLFHDT